uniref:Uncharacterized protein n=1 Tax=Anopheles albimanus TaxID=7167 RepID=A0A182FY18_ANOAL
MYLHHQLVRHCHPQLRKMNTCRLATMVELDRTALFRPGQLNHQRDRHQHVP